MINLSEPLKTKAIIDVLYEDEHLLAVHKPPWYLVHPSLEAKETRDVLSELKTKNLAPIHRLDRQTSGLLLLSKNSDVTREIQKNWHTQKVQKKYLAYVYGRPLEKFESRRPLSDQKSGLKKSAHTSFQTLKYFEKGALIEAQIYTGRRHQIRRHLSHMGHHVLGDRMYGKGRLNQWAKENGLPRLFLHAHSLIFWHPKQRKEIKLHLSLPQDLQNFLSQR